MSKKKRERKHGNGDSPAKGAGSGSEMTRLYFVLGAVAVLGAGILLFRAGSSALDDTVTEPVVVEGITDPQALMQAARGVVKGNPDAEISILEFGDFQCPACQSWFTSVKPMVEAEFIATGVAKFVFHDFPLTQMHPNAFVASRAARCAEEQNKFWEFHDVLFRNQNSWAGQPSPVGRFEDYAEQLGMDAGQFSACLRSDKYADLVTANMTLGQQLQVPSTPTIIVGKGGALPQRADNSVEGIRAAVAALQGTDG